MNVPTAPEVLIIGAGPAGLAAAAALEERGCRSILVVDRDETAGGLPQYCNHVGFGWEYSRRVDSGPSFVRRLLDGLSRGRIELCLRTTALRLSAGPRVELVGPLVGHVEVHPKTILLATGVRESARGPRLTPGARPERGLLTTGLLQQMVSRSVDPAVGRIVIHGTEHVAYSAILTARKAGVATVAMVEPSRRVRSYRIAQWGTRSIFGIPTYLQSEITDIRGNGKVEAVQLDSPAGSLEIPCDGVLFSGGWVPDSPLALDGPVATDAATRGPVIDQLMRTTVSGIFAAGNVLRGVESSGRAALEGRRAGACIAQYLAGGLSDGGGRVVFEPVQPVAYVVPQAWDTAAPAIDGVSQPVCLVRMSEDVSHGRLVLQAGDCEYALTRRRALLKGRQIRISGRGLPWYSTVRERVRIAVE